jgi:uncharacterized protein
MTNLRWSSLPILGVLLIAGCQGWSGAKEPAAPCSQVSDSRISVLVTTAKGSKCFDAERAVGAEQQQQGLMFRTDLGPDSAMLFWPYPPDGPPRVASFWMKNTPTSLDIIFIRPDGTVASIAENTTPFSEDPVPSYEPVGAVLELVAGRAAELGIDEGSRITWPKPQAE